MTAHTFEKVSVANLTHTPVQVTNGLDFYKPTMSQMAFEQEPFAEVTFTLKNRGEQQIADYVSVEQITERFEQLRNRGWSDVELGHLEGLHNTDGERMFTDDYLNYLRTSELPEVLVTLDPGTDDLAIETTGPWAMSTFWETIVMSEVNEMYFENFVRANGLNMMDIYNEGQERLEEKMAILRANPDIKIADFGTRRHFSLKWQNHVVTELANHCPGNLIGTSNVALAREHKIKPIGTFAHEMPMVYAALADARGETVRESHQNFLNDWYERYGEDLSIALTDTFGTDFFFVDFTQEQAENWRGTRHDSGDPFVFAERLIQFYEEKGIDPATKTVVFSDGLNIDQIVALQERFGDRMNVMFGWGTTLTNDLGIPALNIVMKATEVRDTVLNVSAHTVKLSDNAGKHTGRPEDINRYKQQEFVVAV